MKNNIKRVFVVMFLVLTMLLNTACGGNSDNKKPGNSNIDASELETMLNTSKDFGKSDSLYESIKGSTVNLSFFEDPEDDPLTLAIIKDFEKEYNVTVDYKVYNWSEWETRIFQMVSSGTAPDNIWVADENFLSFMARNVIQPIDEWVDLTDEAWNSSAAEHFSWAGKHYAMTAASDISGYFIYYNKEAFEDMNLEDPREMWEDGRWNFDALRKAAKAFVADSDNDGTQDCYGFYTWNLEAFVLANGGSSIKLTDNGSIECTIKNVAEQTGYQMYQDMAFVDKSIPLDITDVNTAFANGKLIMLAERPWNAIGEYDMHNVCDFEIGVVPFPIGPDVEKGKKIVPATLTSMGIAQGAKNPLGAVAFYYYKEKWINENYSRQEYVNLIGSTYKTFQNYKWHYDYVNSDDTVINATHLYGLPSWWDKRKDFILDIVGGVPISTCTSTHIGLFQDGINTILKALSDK